MSKACLTVALLLAAIPAIAENKKKAVQPVIRYEASVLAGEFESPQAAFAAIQATWNSSSSQGSRSAINLHPWRTDVYQSYNGVPYYHMSDVRQCDAGGTCTLSPDTGPYVTTLQPRCPTDKTLVNGAIYTYQLVDVTGDNGLARRFSCILDLPKTEPDPRSCAIGNPVFPATGQKVRYETDYPGLGNVLRFMRTYRSDFGRFASFQTHALVDSTAPSPSRCWPSTYIENTLGQPLRPYCFPLQTLPEQTVTVTTDDWRDLVFYGAAPSPMPRAYQNDRLSQRQAPSGGTEWLLRSAEGRFDVYDTQGFLIRRTWANGSGDTVFRYSDSSTSPSVAPRPGLLTEVQEAFGRRLVFEYDAQARMVRLIDPAGAAYLYTYDAAGNLASVTSPNGQVRGYLYNEPAQINGGTACYANASGFPRALTGITDAGMRYGSFHYNCEGKVVRSELIGGLNRYDFSYGANATDITEPSGAVRRLSYSMVFDYRLLTGSTQPAGSGCAASTSSQSYDANGNLASRDDFNGTRTCYANDLTRNLETVRVEGLTSSATCGTVTPANAVLPTGTRKTSTQWHPDWRLETKTAEPGRLTTRVYNGQPDPFNGNAIASCAPASALLPDGKPIVVLCRQVEQATTDANGTSGFSATLQAGVSPRQTTWTYNPWGQVLTEDGPRTDVPDLTTYAYYPDTTPDHLPGDLKQVTNPAGRITQFTKYNRHGQLLESLDPNGVLTVHTYDLRQRLLSTTVGGQTTAYTYDPAGQLKRITLPDASWIGYDYDDAHRLVSVYDHLGNRIDYTLDPAGNRTGEATRNNASALKRQLSRSVDALNRIQQITGRE